MGVTTLVALFTPSERGFVKAAVRAGLANPFTPEHVAAQREALGALFEPGGDPSSAGCASLADANLARIATKLLWVLQEARGRAALGVSRDDEDLYHAACVPLLCDAYRARSAPVFPGDVAGPRKFARSIGRSVRSSAVFFRCRAKRRPIFVRRTSSRARRTSGGHTRPSCRR